jgi:WD40 repeat protein
MSSLKSKFQLLASLEGHREHICCVALHPSAPILATGSKDQSIILWDTDSHKPVATLLGHTTPVTCLAFHPSAPLLVSGGHDGIMRFWDIMTHQCLSTTQVYRPNYAVSCVAFRPQLTGAEDFDMITGGSSDLLQLWKLSPDNTKATLFENRGHMGNTGYDSKCIAFHPTQPLVATASMRAGNVFDINPARWGLKETLSRSVDLETGRAYHRKGSLSVAFHPTAPIVVTGGQDKNIMLWELRKHAQSGIFSEFAEILDDHDGDVTSVAFHPTAPVLFSCSKDKSIKIWHMAPDQRSAFCIETLTAQSGFTSLMVHPSGRFFATSCEDGTANLWDCSILNIDRQFEIARMRELERSVIEQLIPPESMYRMRRPQKSLIDRVTGRRTYPVMLLQNPSANTGSAKTALTKQNDARLAELWAKSSKPGSPGSPKSPKAGSSKTGSPGSPKAGSSKPGSSGSPKSPKAYKSGGGRKSRKNNSSCKVKRSASKTKHYRKFR